MSVGMLAAIPFGEAQTGKPLGDVMRERAQKAIADAQPAPPSPTKSGGYSIKDLPVDIVQRLNVDNDNPFPNGVSDGIGWINNDQVIFRGRSSIAGVSVYTYIWNTKTGDVAKYGEYSGFCLADGYISAHGPSKIVDGDKGHTVWPVHKGFIGKEQDELCDSHTGTVCRGFLNMSCQSATFRLEDFDLPKNAGVVMQLRQGDGAIVTPVNPDSKWRGGKTGPVSQEEETAAFGQPMLLVNAKFPKGKPLPILSIEQIRKAAYSDYAKRYAFVTQRPKQGVSIGLLTIWPMNQPQPIYLMTPNGEVETVEIPPSSDWNTLIQAIPAVPGIVFQASGVRGNLGGGLFLWNKNEVLALDTGYVESFTVSPDGCSVAYGIVNNYGKLRPSEANFVVKIKMINLCKGNSRLH